MTRTTATLKQFWKTYNRKGSKTAVEWFIKYYEMTPEQVEIVIGEKI